MTAALEVQVDGICQLTPVVREFTLVPVEGMLPGFSCGSHVQVHIEAGGRTLRNAYSLLSDPADRDHYRIAVRLQEASRGGSRFMHEQLRVGDRLRLSPPANLFAPHSRARHHLLIAGGIGITPFLSYIAELQAKGASFELHYAYRAGLTDAYLASLRQRLGERLHGYDSLQGQRLDMGRLLARQKLGTHAYVCGPQSLLDCVREQAATLGWPQSSLHWEAFAAPEPGAAFSVTLTSSGRQIDVPADSSLLETLEAHGVELPNLCRGGVCGQCATGYSSGEVEHRDSYLAPAERATTLMPCVSRGRCGSALTLKL